MQIGTVIGNVWATRKEEELRGLKFLIVEPQYPDGSSSGSPFVAVDKIGAGFGDTVLVTKGSAAANMGSETRLPIDALIIGIVDSIDAGKGG
ncbi:EutN/CcmL family microcompartment protein [Bacillus sp. REN3]|uniref:EutN/CcmL family microcompartment protein n=1 Tax=Bacillus sp. REN3 TaxID=2802440 RepID=UPI001AEE2BF9|nr:EutN/CcmL family microcompartment protein [Bacillus sp. REN3]